MRVQPSQVRSAIIYKDCVSLYLALSEDTVHGAILSAMSNFHLCWSASAMFTELSACKYAGEWICSLCIVTKSLALYCSRDKHSLCMTFWHANTHASMLSICNLSQKKRRKRKKPHEVQNHSSHCLQKGEKRKSKCAGMNKSIAVILILCYVLCLCYYVNIIMLDVSLVFLNPQHP